MYLKKRQKLPCHFTPASGHKGISPDQWNKWNMQILSELFENEEISYKPPIAFQFGPVVETIWITNVELSCCNAGGNNLVTLR
jgi:hypothetical protein